MSWVEGRATRLFLARVLVEEADMPIEDEQDRPAKTKIAVVTPNATPAAGRLDAAPLIEGTPCG
jgi:hypothetical protein